MTIPTEFIFIRHGQSHANSQNILQGQSDSGLDQTGRRQAELLALRLQQQPPFDFIYSSDLKRAHETAKYITEKIGGEIILSSELREWNFGDLQGLQHDELLHKYPDIMRSLYKTGAPVNIPNGESRDEMECRCQGFIETLACRHPGKRLLLVTHGGTLRAIFRRIVAAPKSDCLQPSVANASYSSCVFTAEQKWQLTCWNDVSHLNTIQVDSEMKY